MTILISDIFSAHIDGANFRWLIEPTEKTPSLPKAVNDPADLIGHLNLIHRQRIHVFGPEEIAFVERLDSIRRKNLALDLLNGNPPALIFANDLAPPVGLLELSKEAGVAVIQTSLSSAKVIDRIRNFLVRAVAHSTSVHGVLMDVLGMGILISGDSGLGKSELALELISRGHGLVADDVVELSQLGPHTLEGRCPAITQNFLEVRGLGLLNIRTIFGEAAVRRKIKLRLIVQLVKRSTMEASYERMPLQALTESILGVPVEKVVIPVAAGRNLAVLTEAAVRNAILKLRGIDGTQEFIQQQHKAIAAS
jgi:HPr kinase/phosphorylase